MRTTRSRVAKATNVCIASNRAPGFTSSRRKRGSSNISDNDRLTNKENNSNRTSSNQIKSSTTSCTKMNQTCDAFKKATSIRCDQNTKEADEVFASSPFLAFYRIGSSMVVGLQVDDIIGRSVAKKPKHNHKRSATSSALDLGMNKKNACQIAKETFIVKSMTSSTLTLSTPAALLEKQRNNKAYKHEIIRYKDVKNAERLETNKTEVISTPIVTLEVGDILILRTGKMYPDHQFRVIPYSEAPMWASMVSVEEQPNKPPSPAHLLSQLHKEQEARYLTAPCRKQETDCITNDGDDDTVTMMDDSITSTPRFYEDRDMHATLANTISKALESGTPTVSSDTLTLAMYNRRLPTIAVCRQLVKLLTYGSFHTASESSSSRCNSKLQKLEPKPYMDLQKLTIAENYTNHFLDTYPHIAYARLGEAAGPDYWRNVLQEQLNQLSYYDDNDDKNITKATTKNTFYQAVMKDAHKTQMVHDSLKLHLFSVKKFHSLLYGLCHQPAEIRSSSPIIRNMETSSGGGYAAACRIATNAWVHFFFEFGSHLWEGDGTPLTHIVSELSALLGSIVTLMVDTFIFVGDRGPAVEMKEAVDLLWNSLTYQLEHQVHHHSTQKQDKNWILQIKTYCIESLKHGALEEALARRLFTATELRKWKLGDCA